MALAFENGNYIQTYEGHLENKNTIKVLEMILKIAIYKKGIRIEGEKTMQKVRDQIVWKQVEDTAPGLL